MRRVVVDGVDGRGKGVGHRSAFVYEGVVIFIVVRRAARVSSQ